MIYQFLPKRPLTPSWMRLRGTSPSSQALSKIFLLRKAPVLSEELPMPVCCGRWNALLGLKTTSQESQGSLLVLLKSTQEARCPIDPWRALRAFSSRGSDFRKFQMNTAWKH